MGFDWLLVAGDAPTVGDSAEPAPFQAFCAEARKHGIRIMIDVDPLAAGFETARPEPAADSVVPVDELAEQLTNGLALGVAGFRCRHAHAVPAPAWRNVFDHVQGADGRPVYLADAIGAPLDRILALEGAGFDYLLNSAAWWDFRASWFLDQFEAFRRFTRTVAFPECPSGPRLAQTLGGLSIAAIERVYRQRYLFSAAISSGILLPMGYEYGFGAAARPRRSREESWNATRASAPFDLCEFIADVNRLKAATPALNDEARLIRLAPPEAPVAALLRIDSEDPATAASGAIVCVNPAPAPAAAPPLGRAIRAGGGLLGGFRDMTPQGPHRTYEADEPLVIEPYDARILVGVGSAPPSYAVPADQSEHRLRTLAENRVAIEAVTPELDGGRFPVKRVVGDVLEVAADIFCDGHDIIDAALKYRHETDDSWSETAMVFVDNDRWAGRFALDRIGRWQYTIEAWRDLFASWRSDTAKKVDDGQPVALELVEGTALVATAAAAATGVDRQALEEAVSRLKDLEGDEETRLSLLMGEALGALMRRAGPRTNLSRYSRTLEVVVDRTIAALGAWYELLPRSQSGDPTVHGTFDDVIRRLPYVRDLGFDVLYFPPIHPIGRTNRKGPNNALTAGPDDPGSPYAIGAADGGHDAIHPELGSFDDFRRLVDAARDHGLEIALDFAIQCSPDHPWIRQHPEWFDWRPDGTIKFAENPPKKYEDIVNVHFYRDALPSVWYALRDIVLFWIGHGVKIFRVDNPHTKPLPFWEWMIEEVRARHPDAVFLAEAFTRPKMMKRLAKVGFTQSYSYFTWRNTKQELTDYLTELTRGGSQEYMRVNFFTNTPDINPYFLQTSGRPGFQARLVLAATLSTVYGIYNGFELCEAAAIPGKEEYLDSEKYQLRAWDFDRPGNIREDVRLINRIRRENPALWQFENLAFLNAWNDNIIAYRKMTDEKDNCVLVAVNLDPHHAQEADFEIPLWEFGLPDDAVIGVVDLVSGDRFDWTGKVQHICLDPAVRPYAIWRLVPPAEA